MKVICEHAKGCIRQDCVHAKEHEPIADYHVKGEHCHTVTCACTQQDRPICIPHDASPIATT